jgi:phenylacetic acid degradation operon negative regulatory protein
MDKRSARKTRITAKGLTLDLLSTCGRSAAPVSALVNAAALFGIADNALRVALARLLAQDLVIRDERGRYRLGPTALGVNQQIVGWRSIEQRIGAWSGNWVGVHRTAAGPAGPRSRRSHSQQSRPLRMLGFRTLSPGLEIRPDNLVGGIGIVRERLASLGFGADRDVPGAIVFGMTSLDGDAASVAAKLWETDRLRSDYVELTERLERSASRLATLRSAAAMRETFELGGEGIRQLVVDPLLPDPIAPTQERAALLEAMIRYDRLGRKCWANWLGGESEPEQLPAGVRAAGSRATGVGGLDPTESASRTAPSQPSQ